MDQTNQIHMLWAVLFVWGLAFGALAGYCVRSNSRIAKEARVREEWHRARERIMWPALRAIELGCCDAQQVAAASLGALSVLGDHDTAIQGREVL